MIFSADPGMEPNGLHRAFSRLVEDLNRFHPTIDRLPVFADDVAAAAANLKVGHPYVTPDGFVKRRMG